MFWTGRGGGEGGKGKGGGKGRSMFTLPIDLIASPATHIQRLLSIILGEG